jgi:methyl-accepting chemotaxis protein
MSQTTQQNASSSEELAATAEEMSSQAEQLQAAMAFFRLDSGAAVIALRKPAMAARQATAHPARRSGALRLADSVAAQGEPDENNFTHF